MKFTTTFTNTALAAVLLTAMAVSQAATSTPGQRKENQQDRIAQGVNSGALTAGETKALETKEARLNAETSAMRQADNGNLTAADRAKISRQQNRLSSQIRTDKHNAADQDQGKSTFGRRSENQQDRIAQGIKNGTLRPREAAKLESQQQGTNKEAAGMRQADNGKLTKADKAVLNRQQSRDSRAIFGKKHDGRGR